MKRLDETIEEMRNLGENLVPYNYPKAPIPRGEDELSVLKTREIFVDGYWVIVNYQKSDYDDHFMETLQVYGFNSPFLPFSLICKLAKKFLGGYELSLVEVFKENRKIYIWTVCVDRTGKPIPNPYEIQVEQCTFEGFKYLYLDPSQVNFF